jgi:integrase
MIERSNYLKVRAYLAELRDVDQLAESTLNTYWSRLRILLEWADEIPFEKISKRRPTFPRYLQMSDANQDGRPMSYAWATKCCNSAQAFLTWLRVNDPVIARALPQTFVKSVKMGRQEGREKKRDYYTVDDVLALVSLPGETVRDMRDRAAVAFLFLSGMRVGAFVTMPVEALDLDAQAVRQWPELGMHTKNSKAATTYLLDIPELFAVVKRWDDYARSELADNAMWFDVLDRLSGGLSGATDANPQRSGTVRRMLQKLCERAGVTYRSVHKLRHGHTMYAVERAHTVADFKAISQNLMHASVTITDQVYGVLPREDVHNRIAGLSRGEEAQPGADGSLALDEKTRAQLMALLSQFAKDLNGGTGR